MLWTSDCCVFPILFLHNLQLLLSLFAIILFFPPLKFSCLGKESYVLGYLFLAHAELHLVPVERKIHHLENLVWTLCTNYLGLWIVCFGEGMIVPNIGRSIQIWCIYESPKPLKCYEFLKVRHLQSIYRCPIFSIKLKQRVQFVM